ncbi:MAG: ATP/GTP-binding protein [Oscillospiraceae bacterium]|nr:ATP/GTP-binding protein [Oscillospiraceae bacterium]
MLINASFENFKSFDELTELTMISSNKIRTPIDHKSTIRGTSVLKSAAIYGANAAGKSNLIEAFHFYKYCVTKGLPTQSVQLFCKNKESNETRESSFELQMTINDAFYAYGFSAILSEMQFTSEWLYELLPDGSSKPLFTKDNGKKPVLGSSIKLSTSEKNKYKTYSDDFEDNNKSLFLTEMNRNKKIDTNSKLSFFQIVYEWIANKILIYTPDMPITDFELYYNEKSLSLVNKLIQTFDTGITQVKIEEISLDDLTTRLPKSILNDVMNDLRTEFEKSDKDKASLSMRSESSFFNVELKGKLEPKITTIRLKHGKSFFDFDFDEESDGTRRLFDLIDMLLNAGDDVVFLVDELERSLHPKLTYHFIELFMEFHREHSVQLIFTTHESSIMDQSLFRRDEIWFVERNSSNASTLYSLDRFKERYDKKIDKAYLDGRYGAIPVFSTFTCEEEL